MCVCVVELKIISNLVYRLLVGILWHINICGLLNAKSVVSEWFVGNYFLTS